MIDLRSHILDGTPCGPQSFAESIEVCRSAVAVGVKTVVATPRWDVRRTEPPVPFADCRKKVEHLSEELRGTLAVKLGFLLPFSQHLPELVERHGHALAICGWRYLLISPPPTLVNKVVEEVWDKLELRGFSVVISGPECSPALRRDPARLAGWVARGFFLQINAASIIGAYGREVRRFAFECLQKHERHTIVTLNIYGVDAQKRIPGIAPAPPTVQLGRRRAELFLRETPMKILGGSDAETNIPVTPDRNRRSVLRSLQPLKSLIGI